MYLILHFEMLWKVFPFVGDEGHVVWNGSWISFLDTMLQIHQFNSRGRGLRLYTRAKAVHIDPAAHLDSVIEFQGKSGRILNLSMDNGRENRSHSNQTLSE